MLYICTADQNEGCGGVARRIYSGLLPSLSSHPQICRGRGDKHTIGESVKTRMQLALEDCADSDTLCDHLSRLSDARAVPTAIHSASPCFNQKMLNATSTPPPSPTMMSACARTFAILELRERIFDLLRLLHFRKAR